MTKVIIAGGRDFKNYLMLRNALHRVFKTMEEGCYRKAQIVLGGARGIDALGERFAKEHSMDLKIFAADWDKYGKSAGYIRNSVMGKYATMLVAFWDGESRGTKHMIDTMKKMKKEVIIIYY